MPHLIAVDEKHYVTLQRIAEALAEHDADRLLPGYTRQVADLCREIASLRDELAAENAANEELAREVVDLQKELAALRGAASREGGTP